jgi:hypothetical protein
MTELIVNELLCYCKNKFDLATNKQLKLILNSFYTEEELSDAKQLLHEAASKVISDYPRLIKRNKSDNRCKLLVDDLIDYLTKVDENNCWEKLPVYVARNISRIPTVPIEDIEIFIMAERLERVDSRLKRIEVERSAISRDDNETVRVLDPGNKKEDGASAQGHSGGYGATASGAVRGNGQDSSGGSRGVLLEGSGSAESGRDDGAGTWAMVARRGVKKSLANKQKVVGINKAQSLTIKSAKQLQRKFIFHLDNVSGDPPCAEIQSFMEGNGVEVLSCFAAKSWIHYKNEDGNTCHAFRVCIKLDDKLKVLDGAFWPEGVLVREWKFKKSSDDGGK